MKKASRKKLKKKLDDVFREYIRVRDPICITCGSCERLQISHFFGRVALSTRWDERNSHMQCQGDHMRFHLDNPEPYRRAMIVLYGRKIFNEIELHHNQTVKYTEGDLREMIKYYEEKIEELK